MRTVGEAMAAHSTNSRYAARQLPLVAQYWRAAQSKPRMAVGVNRLPAQRVACMYATYGLEASSVVAMPRQSLVHHVHCPKGLEMLCSPDQTN